MYVHEAVQILSLPIILRLLQNKIKNAKQIIIHEDELHVIGLVEYPCGTSISPHSHML
jgi:hypothetical protein